MGDLSGKRIMVIGASSGVGRVTSAALAKHGATLAISARRTAQLEEVRDECGGAHVVTLDAMEPDSVRAGVSAAAQAMGGLDAVLYAAGMSTLGRLVETTSEELQRIFTTNTFGPIHAFNAAFEHASPHSVFAVLSSEAAFDPRYGLTPYSASKAALEVIMRGFRNEHLEGHRFVTIQIGPTMPSEFSGNFDQERFAAVIPHWLRQGLHTALQQGTDVGELVAESFGVLFNAPTLGIENMLLRSPHVEQPAAG